MARNFFTGKNPVRGLRKKYNYRSSVDQHVFLQTVEAGYNPGRFIVFPKMDKGNLWSFTGLGIRQNLEDNFCKLTKNPYKLTCNCHSLVIWSLLIVTNNYIC